MSWTLCPSLSRTKRKTRGWFETNPKLGAPYGQQLYDFPHGGETWQRRDEGFPREQAWWTVKRQALCNDTHDPMGIYLGNTGGEVWATTDEGASFQCLFRHLPHVFAVTTGEPA